MRAVEKRLRQRIKGHEVTIAELTKELDEIRNDRNRFRDHFKQRFQWWVKLMGEGKGPSLPWLVEDDAKWLQRFQFFIW